MTVPKWALEQRPDGTYQAVRWMVAKVHYTSTHSVRERRAFRAANYGDALRELEELNKSEESKG